MPESFEDRYFLHEVRAIDGVLVAGMTMLHSFRFLLSRLHDIRFHVVLSPWPRTEPRDTSGGGGARRGLLSPDSALHQ